MLHIVDKRPVWKSRYPEKLVPCWDPSICLFTMLCHIGVHDISVICCNLMGPMVLML